LWQNLWQALWHETANYRKHRGAAIAHRVDFIGIYSLSLRENGAVERQQRQTLYTVIVVLFMPLSNFVADFVA